MSALKEVALHLILQILVQLSFRPFHQPQQLEQQQLAFMRLNSKQTKMLLGSMPVSLKLSMKLKT